MIGNSDRVILPIGIEVNGVRHREVVIDEMSGIDEENLISRKVRNNGAKAITVLLQRCIQEIPGVLERKKNPYAMVDEALVRSMFVADRDYLLLCIRALSDKGEVASEFTCKACGSQQFTAIKVSELPIYEWDDSPAEVVVEMQRGFYDVDSGKHYPRFTWAFPTGKTQEKLAEIDETQMGSALIASGIRSVEGLRYTPSLEDVRRLSMRDRQAISEQIASYSVGVETKTSCACDSCGEENEFEVNVAGFFSSVTPKTSKPAPSGTSGRRLRKSR